MSMISLLLIIAPIVFAVALFCAPEKYKQAKSYIFIVAAIFNLWAVCAYFSENVFAYAQWAAFDFSFSIVTSQFNMFLLVIAAFFAALTAIFALNNMKNNPKASMFGASMMLAVSFVNGVLITDSLLFVLIFIEALAVPFVLMILSSENNNKKLALKAFTITAIADLFFMAGIALAYCVAKTMNISEISITLNSGLEIAAFIFIMVGAAGKLGVMPFHSWMPEASEKTSVPFMVFMATAAEKILGIYIIFIALKMFNVAPGSTVTCVIAAVVAVGAIIAALLSNKQGTFKKMLVYTSISQGSFMMIAMLTAIPVAIAGAVLHLLAHTVYKSSLFYVAGVMDDSKESVISFKNNPYIFTCFILAAASFIGVPFFAAFFSKEMMYEGAMNAGIIWLAVMMLITFFCSSAILDWMGKIFFGNEGKHAEYPVSSMIAVVTAAFLCLLLGIFKKVPLTVIEEKIHFAEHSSTLLLAISLAMLFIVLINFIVGYVKYKNGLGFVKGIISFLKIDKLNENSALDPYNLVGRVYKSFGKASFDFDKFLNWVYDSLFVNSVLICSSAIKRVHNGSLSRYIVWVLLGIAVIVLFFV